eukprot:TRINITY_DN10496_c0_g1_i2.p2 TRINITY_DN10496_c0_g1~~TRINITY_DN10496_c0_g1_i2.p2  ORF type:complete len:376 (+),score=39.75 TRINITY_DN10496_c0_g1_i2:1172-2299(+)
MRFEWTFFPRLSVKPVPLGPGDARLTAVIPAKSFTERKYLVSIEGIMTKWDLHTQKATFVYINYPPSINSGLRPLRVDGPTKVVEGLTRLVALTDSYTWVDPEQDLPFKFLFVYNHHGRTLPIPGSVGFTTDNEVSFTVPIMESVTDTVIQFGVFAMDKDGAISEQGLLPTKHTISPMNEEQRAYLFEQFLRPDTDWDPEGLYIYSAATARWNQQNRTFAINRLSELIRDKINATARQDNQYATYEKLMLAISLEAITNTTTSATLSAIASQNILESVQGLAANCSLEWETSQRLLSVLSNILGVRPQSSMRDIVLGVGMNVLQAAINDATIYTENTYQTENIYFHSVRGNPLDLLVYNLITGRGQILNKMVILR